MNKANDFIKKIKSGYDFVKVAQDNFNLTLNDIDIGFVKKSELPSSVVNLFFKVRLKT